MESLPLTDNTAAEQRIAFTGRLATMTRAEAAAFVRRCGAEFSPSVTRRTTLLVAGEEGWPLRADGRITRKLQAARRLRRGGLAIEIVREAEFFERFTPGGDERHNVRRACTLLELTRMLGIRRDAVRAWLRAGLIQPVDVRNGVPSFDFGQVSRAKRLVALLDDGVPLRTVRRSLQQMQSWMQGVEATLDCLSRIHHDGSRVLFASPEGDLFEPSGQRLLDFDVGDQPGTVAFAEPAGDLFDVAVRHEDAGEFAAARNAYQQLLQVDGPDADVCFNLGNVLHALGERGAACERFRQAVELDPSFAEAWLNLGIASAEGRRTLDAARAFERALAIDPSYGEARCGLADALDELGRHDEARGHWGAYLRGETEGDWAEYARSRLSPPA